MPAIKVACCVPLVPMRMVLDSPATPGLPISILLLPVVRFRPAYAQCDVVVAGGVAEERIKTDGRVSVAGCVADESALNRGRVVRCRLCCYQSAQRPLAVLSLPVVLLKSALSTDWPCLERRLCC